MFNLLNNSLNTRDFPPHLQTPKYFELFMVKSEDCLSVKKGACWSVTTKFRNGQNAPFSEFRNAINNSKYVG